MTGTAGMTDKLKLEELENRTKLLTVDRAHQGVVSATIYFYFKVGSRNEPTDQHGIAHFVEHMLFKGTSQMPKLIDVIKILDNLGITFNAFTDKHTTGYHFKFLSNPDSLATICRIAHQMFYHSLFRASDIRKECDVIIEEYNAIMNDPLSLFDELLEAVYFKNSSLEHMISGSPESLKAIKRSYITEFHRRYYNPENLVIVIGGKIPPNASEIIGNKFGHVRRILKIDEITLQPKINTFMPVFNTSQLIIPREMEQNIISIIFPTAGLTDERRFKLICLKKLLGSCMSSRLFVNIRSKLGLVYTISANINNYLEGGYFSIDFQTNPKATKRCISAVEKELEIIREKGFSRQEFTRIHNNYISGVLMSLEYNNMITEFYGEQLLYYNKIETFESYFEKIKNVNLSDINKLASSFLKKYKIIIYGRSV